MGKDENRKLMIMLELRDEAGGPNATSAQNVWSGANEGAKDRRGLGMETEKGENAGGAHHFSEKWCAMGRGDGKVTAVEFRSLAE